jgi:3-oxoadipate CoA-transferase beta subunit
MMELLTRDGTCKLVERCSYPLTGLGCVSRVYTDLAIFEVGRQGARVLEIFNGMSFSALSDLVGLPLTDARQ